MRARGPNALILAIIGIGMMLGGVAFAWVYANVEAEILVTESLVVSTSSSLVPGPETTPLLGNPTTESISTTSFTRTSVIPVPTVTRPVVTQPGPVVPTQVPPLVTAPLVPVILAEGETLVAVETNALRVEAGLAPVGLDLGLRDYARDWALHMAVTKDFEHSNIENLLDGWVFVGENIGQGGDVGSVVEGLVESPEHLSNMLEPTFTDIGVGVAVDGEGKVWICQVFASEELPPETVATTITVPELTLPGVTLP